MLQGVAAASSADVWAVGSYLKGSTNLTLLEHWDGTQWTQETGPSPDPSNNFLYGVAMIPSGEAWAVGSAGDGLILHYSDPCVTPSPAPSPSRTATPTITLSASPTQSPTTATTTTVTTSTPTDTATASQTLQPSATACAIQFSDVPPGSTFYLYIHCLACLGIINGYPDGTFRPNNNVTGGQLSKIACISPVCDEIETTQYFQDVPPDSTFFRYIGHLASLGYIGGYPCGGPGEPCVPPANLPYFRSNTTATRGQISKIISNAAGFSNPPSGQQFEDVPVGSTYYTFTYRLVSRSIMGGYPCGGAGEPCIPPGYLPYFRPNNDATRGQTSKIVANTFFPNCQTPDTKK